MLPVLNVTVVVACTHCDRELGELGPINVQYQHGRVTRAVLRRKHVARVNCELRTDFDMIGRVKRSAKIVRTSGYVGKGCGARGAGPVEEPR
jgi:hypothetical protein